jgi:hypothetical protein
MNDVYMAPVDEAAYLYAKAGWPVLPLHDATAGYCSCDDGPLCRVSAKHPRLRAGFHSATTDLRRIEDWWSRWPHANIGITMGGQRGLVVVDLDGEVGRESWQRLIAEHGAGLETAIARTPHGLHYWYRTQSGLSVPRRIGSVATHVDILGDGGYAVAPPSVVGREHPGRHEGECSGRYQWTTRRAQIAQLPGWVAELANRREHVYEGMECGTPEHVRTVMRRVAGDGYGEVALRGEATRVASARAADHNRNHTLNTAAYRLGRLVAGGELDRADVERALWAACEPTG